MMKKLNTFIWVTVAVALVLAVVFTFTLERKTLSQSSSSFSFNEDLNFDNLEDLSDEDREDLKELEDFLGLSFGESFGGAPFETTWFYFDADLDSQEARIYSFEDGVYELSVNGVVEEGEYELTDQVLEDGEYVLELTPDSGEEAYEITVIILGDFSADINGKVFSRG